MQGVNPFRGGAPKQEAQDEPGRSAAQPVDPIRATRVVAWVATAIALLFWPAGFAFAHFDWEGGAAYLLFCFGGLALMLATFAWARLWQVRRESPESILRRVYDADLAERDAEAPPSPRVRVDASAAAPAEEEAPEAEVEEDKSRRAPVP